MFHINCNFCRSVHIMRKVRSKFLKTKVPQRRLQMLQKQRLKKLNQLKSRPVAKISLNQNHSHLPDAYPANGSLVMGLELVALETIHWTYNLEPLNKLTSRHALHMDHSLAQFHLQGQAQRSASLQGLRIWVCQVQEHRWPRLKF